MQSSSMRAPCGIDCATCTIYIAANDPAEAEKLAAEWRAGWQPEATPQWFECQGCRSDRSVCWSRDCRIYACCAERRSLDLCSECDEFPCAEIAEWGASPAHHQKAFEWLKQEQKEGA